MADPARKLPEFHDVNDPRYVDPKVPPTTVQEERAFERANAEVDRTVVEQRGMGSGAMIAIGVVILALLAYFLFMPGTAETPAPANPPAATSEPATPAPAPAPADPAPATPAPAPATPAPAPTTPPANN